MATTNPISFRRLGRSLQPVIRTAADLAVAVELDEVHWVSTAAPIEGLHVDDVFLRWVDADGNGRIMCWEMRDAVAWLLDVLTDRAGIDQRSAAIRLADINTRSPVGQNIRAAAQKMLRRRGAGDGDFLTLDQIRRIKQQVQASSVSEAGVVLPEAAEQPEIRQFLTDIIIAVDGMPHPSDHEGVDQETLERFMAESAAHLAWLEQGRPPADGKTNDVFPLGDQTAAAYEIVRALRHKLDQYFAQCHAVALDAELAGRMGWTAAELDTLDLDDLAAIDKLLTDAPIARAQATLELAYDSPINPHDEAALEQFRRQVAEPIVGKSATLSAKQWAQIKQVFAAHDAWSAAKATTNIAAIDPQALQTYQDERFARAVRALIADSEQTAFHLDNIRLVEKLVLYQAGMIDLANNFVAFPDLYDPARRAIFEMGSLVIDGSRFDFAVKVDNRAEHARMAAAGNMFLMYVEVTPHNGGAPFELAAPVTAGNKGNLCVGKRGIFQGRDGREHGARIVHIVENPISLREAMVAPFVRLGRLLTGKIESITTEAEKKLDAKATATMSQVSAPAAGPGKSPMATGGMLLGAGVAVAALGSALAYTTEKLTKLHWWEICIGVGGAVFAVLLPTIIVAWMKLRKRDLSAILEASGWAINARMRLTRKMGRAFTRHSRPPRQRLTPRQRRRIAKAIAILVVAAILAYVIVHDYRRRHTTTPTTQPAPTKPPTDGDAPDTPPGEPPTEPTTAPTAQLASPVFRTLVWFPPEGRLHAPGLGGPAIVVIVPTSQGI